LSWKNKKTALRIGLIQIHSKNETNTFEKIFWVQGCFEDYFLHTLNYAKTVFFSEILNNKYRCRFIRTTFSIKVKGPFQLERAFLIEQYVKIN